MFRVREGTIDRLVFESIVRHNEYALSARFASDDVIVDIGAHIGAFSYAALQRGAGQIYAIEADKANCELAAQNLQDAIAAGRVVLMWGAAWRSDIDEPVLYHGGYSIDQQIVNTGGGGVIWQKEGEAVPAIAFDQIIAYATDQGQRNIRLLKIDCEGAEWPILLTSQKLQYVDEICGEFHEIGGAYDSHTTPFVIPGYERFTIDELNEFLTAHGFDVSHHRHAAADGTPSNIGIFFATRAPLDELAQAEVATPAAVIPAATVAPEPQSSAWPPGYRPLPWAKRNETEHQGQPDSNAYPPGFRPLRWDWRSAEAE